MGKKKPTGTIGSRTQKKPAATIRGLLRLPWPTFFGTSDANFLPEAKDILRGQRRDDTMGSSHDGLLTRLLRLERLAANPQAVRFDFIVTERSHARPGKK